MTQRLEEVRFPVFPKKNSKQKNVHVAEVNQWHCLEESRQWLENAHPTHLVVASGKLVQQKEKKNEHYNE